MAKVNYKLSEGTREAVREAGVEGSGAREHLAKAQEAQAYQGGVNEIYKGVEAIKEENKKKKEGDLDAEEAWDTGFDSMDSRQDWASPALYDQFSGMEAEYRDKYLVHVKSGDVRAQKKALKEQSVRSSNLQEWKKTMLEAYSVHSREGWGKVITGNTPAAERKRAILKAMSTVDGTVEPSINDKGEMVFTVPGIGEVTHREVKDMVASGKTPTERHDSFVTDTQDVVKSGRKGETFSASGYNNSSRKALTAELLKSPDFATSVLDDAWAGETSLGQDLRDSKVIQNMDFSVEFPDNLISKGSVSKGSTRYPTMSDGKVRVKSLDVDGDGKLTAADFTEENASALIEALKTDPHLLAVIAADWRTMKLENIHIEAKNVYEEEREQEYIKTLSAKAQEQHLATKEATRRSSLTPTQRAAEDLDRRNALVQN